MGMRKNFGNEQRKPEPPMAGVKTHGLQIDWFLLYFSGFIMTRCLSECQYRWM